VKYVKEWKTCDICGREIRDEDKGILTISAFQITDYRNYGRAKYNDICLTCAKKIYATIQRLEQEASE